MKNLIVMFLIVFGINASAREIKNNPDRGITLISWIDSHLAYPETAIQNGEQGKVYVSFTISADGKAENIAIEQGISPSLDNEAMRVVSNMPFNDLKEEYVIGKTYILPISFTIK